MPELDRRYRLAFHPAAPRRLPVDGRSLTCSARGSATDVLRTRVDYRVRRPERPAVAGLSPARASKSPVAGPPASEPSTFTQHLQSDLLPTPLGGVKGVGILYSLVAQSFKRSTRRILYQKRATSIFRMPRYLEVPSDVIG
jgi:hypothetical protein